MATSAAAAERDAVLAVYDGTMSAGSVWHLIDSDWLHQWAAYVGVDLSTRQPVQPASTTPPPAIPNDRLRDPAYPSLEVLRPHSLEGSDYELVPHAVAELLFQRYAAPGTPRFARSVIELGTLAKEQRVDVRPAVLTLVPLTDAGEERDSEAEVMRYASNTKWSDIRDMLVNAERSNDIYDEEKEEGNAEGKPKMRFWLEKPSAEEQKESIAPASATSLSSSSSASSSYIADPFRSASTMLKGGEGPLTENSSAFDLSSHAAATAASASSASSTAFSSASASSATPARQYVLLSEHDMPQPLDAYPITPLCHVLVDRLLPSGRYSRSSEPASFRQFQIGDKLDVKDTIHKWLVSNVRDVKEGKVFIHFQSWDTKWDEWIDIDSDRLAPLHTHTDSSTTLTSSSLSSHSPYSSSSYSFSYNSNEEGTPSPSGAVGLRNLGNTSDRKHLFACCQILRWNRQAAVPHLEINRTNPLGWNGRIAEEYGSLLQQYWSNRYTVVAPRAFKQALGEFQPRFSGYQQHDSQELLSFLLDGLHEDLNRVIKKPATQGVDSAGREDEVVAKEAWDVYKLRNQSVVVDHMMGQLKSRVVCPQPGCGHISITFDPYCTLSLPLPTVNDHVQTLFVVFADSTKPVTRVNVVTSKVAPLSELRTSLSIATSVPAHRFVLADVWAHRLYKVLDEDSSVADIRPADLIYAYELPALDNIKPADVVLAQLIQQKVSEDSTSMLYGNRLRQEVFGLPRVMALSKKDMVTGKQIKCEIDRLMEGWVKEAVDEPEGATSTAAELQVEGQPSTGLDMLLDATVKDDHGQVAGAEAEGGVPGGEMDTAERGEGELEGETQMEGEEGRERDRDSGQSSAESSDSNGYVLVKSPQDDAIMTSGEGEGEGIEGDTAADVEGERSATSSPPPPYSSSASPSVDPLSPYRIVQLDSDGRHCLRCPMSNHCNGCALPIDDETMQLPSNSSSSYSSYSYSSFDRSEPKLVFGIEWSERSAQRYNEAKETVDTSGTDPSSSSASAHDEHRVNLADCLAAFCKEETLSEQDPWYCSRCKDFRCASKKMDLFSLPDLLILHLKRFAYTSRSREKISTLVHFPIRGLDLSHIGGRAGAEGAGGIYDLFAVSNHMGGLGGGHYTAYVRNRVAGVWYLHDDSRVSEVSEDEIVSSSAYVLFYRRRGVKDAGEGDGATRGGAGKAEDGAKGDDVEGGDDSDGREGYTQLDADGVPKSDALIHDHFALDSVKRSSTSGNVQGI